MDVAKYIYISRGFHNKIEMVLTASSRQAATPRYVCVTQNNPKCKNSCLSLQMRHIRQPVCVCVCVCVWGELELLKMELLLLKLSTSCCHHTASP